MIDDDMHTKSPAKSRKDCHAYNFDMNSSAQKRPDLAPPRLYMMVHASSPNPCKPNQWYANVTGSATMICLSDPLWSPGRSRIMTIRRTHQPLWHLTHDFFRRTAHLLHLAHEAVHLFPFVLVLVRVPGRAEETQDIVDDPGLRLVIF